MKNYEFWIETYAINPAIGGKLCWGAKAKVKETHTGRIDDFVTLSEHLGETEDDAMNKATVEANSWIARQLHNTQ